MLQYIANKYKEYARGGSTFINKEKIVTALATCTLFGSILIGNIGYAKSIVYPKTNHSVSEMYKKETDFMGENPGKGRFVITY